MPRAPSNAPCARQTAGRLGAAPGLAVLCLGLSIAAATAEEREPLLPVAREVKETQQQPAPAAEAEPKAQTAAARSDWRPAPSAGRSPYDALIARYAAAYDVPLPIAHAVIKKESGYNANATGLGTVGLMQIKPATARGIGYTGTTKGLYDPETNLTWGMKYLARAYQLGGRDVCGMALRYQGGHRATRMTAASREYCADLKRILATSGASEFAVARDTAPAAEPVVAAAFAPLPEPRPTPALLAAAEAAEA
ncbi:lytic transglycosylase domain-containing protein, partial [Propylenella binzhouense]